MRNDYKIASFQFFSSNGSSKYGKFETVRLFFGEEEWLEKTEKKRKKYGKFHVSAL